MTTHEEAATHNTQIAPFPDALAELVEGAHYKSGWYFKLSHIDRGQGSIGLTLVITVFGKDAYHPEKEIGVNHLFIVPAAAYNKQSWTRWLFDRVRDVETHEAMEFFRIAETRPYAPNHGPGHDPYYIRELATEEERRTSAKGVVKQAYPAAIDWRQKISKALGVRPGAMTYTLEEAVEVITDLRLEALDKP